MFDLLRTLLAAQPQGGFLLSGKILIASQFLIAFAHDEKRLIELENPVKRPGSSFLHRLALAGCRQLDLPPVQLAVQPAPGQGRLPISYRTLTVKGNHSHRFPHTFEGYPSCLQAVTESAA